MKLIIGNKYIIHGTKYVYDGIWPQHSCDRCGKPRDKIYAFVMGEPSNPSQVTKYGSECIKHISIRGLD